MLQRVSDFPFVHFFSYHVTMNQKYAYDVSGVNQIENETFQLLKLKLPPVISVSMPP